MLPSSSHGSSTDTLPTSTSTPGSHLGCNLYRWHPDELHAGHDFYNNCLIFPQLVYAVLLTFGSGSIMVLRSLNNPSFVPLRIFTPSANWGQLPDFSIFFAEWGQSSSGTPVLFLIGFVALFVLLALVSEVSPPRSRVRQIWVRLPYFLIFNGTLMLVTFSQLLVVGVLLLMIFVPLYLCLSVLHGCALSWTRIVTV